MVEEGGKVLLFFLKLRKIQRMTGELGAVELFLFLSRFDHFGSNKKLEHV